MWHRATVLKLTRLVVLRGLRSLQNLHDNSLKRQNKKPGRGFEKEGEMIDTASGKEQGK
jgi:hypothetical protein